MMKFHRALCAFSIAVAFTTAQAQVAADETLRLDATLASPWGAPLGPGPAIGSELRLASRVMAGPAPLNCPGARHQFLLASAQGLFEGNLPEPAAQSAAALGLPGGLITQRIGCANASFDVHRSAAGRAWLGLDNAVLRWNRVSIADSPEATVQTLLVQHFGSGFAVSPTTVAAQGTLLTASLASRFDRWFTRTKTSDEVPELNGDPYTDSQEDPASFELTAARVKGGRAEITVLYRGEGRDAYPVHVELTRLEGKWRVNDLRYRDGRRLSQLLAL